MKVRSRLLRETYYFTRLTCGLPLFFIPKPSFNEKSAMLSINFGSIDLSFCPPGNKNLISTPPGVAHFLEHLMFNKPSGNIMDEFARYGGYYNASTGYNKTSYYVMCSDNFRKNLDILLRLVNQPHFTETAAAKEKLIIEQEAKMYLDIPDIKVQYNLRKNLYHAHPVRHEIEGTLTSIDKITPSILQQCYDTFYQPGNIVVVITGDLDYQTVVNQINNYFTKTPGSGKSVASDIRRNQAHEPSHIKEQRSDINLAVSRPSILVGYKEQNLSLTGQPFIKQILSTEILLDCLLGKGSRLYNQLYNEGLIDDSFATVYDYQKTYGLTIIGVETNQPDLFYERLLKGIKRAQQARLKQKDVERIKRKYLGRFAAFYDSPEQIGAIFTAYHFNNLKVFDTPKYIKSISLKDVQTRLAVHLNETYQSVSIIRPNGKP